MLHFRDAELVAANHAIERRWRLVPGGLAATVLRDLCAGVDWIQPSELPSVVPPGPVADGAQTVSWDDAVAAPPWEGPAERGRLTVTAADGSAWSLLVTVPADGNGITCELACTGRTADGSGHPGRVAASGIEVDGPRQDGRQGADQCELLQLAIGHLALEAVDLVDQTDVRGNLVHSQSWRLYPGEQVAARANIATIAPERGGPGLTIVRHAPAPHARPWTVGPDVVVHRGVLRLLGHGCAGTGVGYAWTTLVHGAGAHDRATAMHRLSRQRRRVVAGREGRLITNTWGDRNRDARIAETFLVAEAKAAADIGADALQVDAGWQKGVDANSVASKGNGVWDGFWAADPAFWQPHPQRLPHGLEPVSRAVARHGLELGLWFAPDSSNDFANAMRDAEALAAHTRAQPVGFWKFDATKLRSRAGELRQRALLERLWRDFDGRAWVDFDLTAEERTGYLGTDPIGTVFVENRYTDWTNWWPHETLRTLWDLAWWVPPQRLRIEFLNPERNREKYGDDPLAPARYPLDWPLATALVASPLGWFEASGLPPAFRTAIKRLVRIWKRERDGLHACTILPVGTRPDGASTCGFLGCDADGAQHLLVFREPLAADAPIDIPLPCIAAGWRRVAGAGSCTVTASGVRVRRLAAPGWAWFRATGIRAYR